MVYLGTFSLLPSIRNPSLANQGGNILSNNKFYIAVYMMLIIGAIYVGNMVLILIEMMINTYVVYLRLREWFKNYKEDLDEYFKN